jgi:hypothetical protein
VGLEDAVRVRELKGRGLSATEIAKMLGFQCCEHRGALIFAEGDAPAGLLAGRPCSLQPD